MNPYVIGDVCLCRVYVAARIPISTLYVAIFNCVRQIHRINSR